MIEETTNSPYNFEKSRQYQSHLKNTMGYLKDKINPSDVVLDIGSRNPLTELIERRLSVNIHNTIGDLDDDFAIPGYFFDKVIYSHTIEHQFNPLHTLLKIKPYLNPKAKIYILLPDRGKLLWCKGHFHEIDEYRMGLLAKRSGFSILSKTKQKVWREWWFYLTGIRPLMRLLFEYHAVYELIFDKSK